MTIPTSASPVIVCVDSHEHSQLAVAWAAQEASLRKGWLLIAHVEPKRTNHPSYSTRSSRAVVESAVQLAAMNHSGLAVGSRFVFGPLAEQLVELSEGAQLLVVGSNKLRDGKAPQSSASLAEFVTTRAACPVVVVGAPSANLARTPLRVVAVMSGDDRANRAACWIAAAEADLRKAQLEVLVCDNDQGPHPLTLPGQSAIWSTTDSALAELTASYPAVEITVIHPFGDTANLATHAEGADLLVVGPDQGVAGHAASRRGHIASILQTVNCTVLVVGEQDSPVSIAPPAAGSRPPIDHRPADGSVESLVTTETAKNRPNTDLLHDATHVAPFSP